MAVFHSPISSVALRLTTANTVRAMAWVVAVVLGVLSGIADVSRAQASDAVSGLAFHAVESSDGFPAADAYAIVEEADSAVELKADRSSTQGEDDGAAQPQLRLRADSLGSVRPARPATITSTRAPVSAQARAPPSISFT